MCAVKSTGTFVALAQFRGSQPPGDVCGGLVMLVEI